MAKVLVLYYSTYGHTEAMAQAMAEGARSAGATVDIKRVPETVPEDVAMRLVNGEPITRLCLPGRNESGIDFAIQLTGRIIGDVEQGDLFGRSSAMGADYSK